MLSKLCLASYTQKAILFSLCSSSYDKHVGDVEASKKRKSSEGDSPIPVKCPKMSIIVPDPNVPQIGTGNDAGPSHQVEPEKEKNPLPEPEPEGESEEEFVDRTAFKEKLLARQYKHRGSCDILVVGKQYRERIMRLLDFYMNEHGPVTFFMVYQCKLKKYNPDGTEESVDVYFHSKNRRLLSNNFN